METKKNRRYRDDGRKEAPVDSTLFLEKVWAKLKTAIDTREGDWRTPTLATVDNKGAPDARLIVLRTICPEHLRYEFYTDCASQKVDDIGAHAAVSLCFWDPKDKLQLRLYGTASLVNKRRTEARWQALNPTSQAQYLQTPPPGKPMSPEQRNHETSKSRFVVYEINVSKLDALQLAKPTHLRIKAKYDQGTWKPVRVAP